ncbi:MAG: GH3 auxin-responsive promoter family protein [Gammaproteobacteria bacterium]|nr:GH3 auxin-responsive promoter family protein [Gammaproteobacteria bacterium]
MTPELAHRYIQSLYSHPIELQEKVLQILIKTAEKTLFGQEHGFSEVKNYLDYKKHVPVREYNQLNKYWELILKNENNILWPGKPLYLIATSASTGAPKILPGTSDFFQAFTNSIMTMLMQYIYETDYSLFNGKFMNFTGSMNFKNINTYQLGPVSAMLRLNTPDYLAQNMLPSKNTLNLMDSQGWDVMFKQAAKEGTANKITVCSGLPSWMIQFFNACLELSGKQSLSEVLPTLKLLLTSGVNYRPYLAQFNDLFNNKITIREMYGASEGCFAFQESTKHESMLLNLSNGIYFEFINLDDNTHNNPKRFNISEVKPDRPYVMIISTCSGLWSYKMGDIIAFDSILPYRIKVLGRTNHFISIQTEHVYTQHVESAIQEVNNYFKIDINNFTVAPNIITENCMPYHIWYIETPHYHGINLEVLANRLDQALIKNSTGYAKSRARKSLAEPKVVLLQPGAFIKFLTTKNNTSLQLKVPKVSNDRAIAEFLIKNDLIITSDQQTKYQLF